MEKEEIIDMIARRDEISWEEAREAIQECQEAIDWLVLQHAGIDEVEQALMEELGLEPDYLLAFL